MVVMCNGGVNPLFEIVPLSETEFKVTYFDSAKYPIAQSSFHLISACSSPFPDSLTGVPTIATLPRLATAPILVTFPLDLTTPISLYSLRYLYTSFVSTPLLHPILTLTLTLTLSSPPSTLLQTQSSPQLINLTFIAYTPPSSPHEPLDRDQLIRPHRLYFRSKTTAV